ncbi:MAG: PAS domain S-box protein, partial [Bacteroidetes bacterium]|nr:PAS domain S-box protein [Bacteroidota bacterium]
MALLNDKEEITHINTTFEKTFQFTPDEVRGKTLLDLIVPVKCISEHKGIIRKVENGEFVQLETIRKRKDNKNIDVLAVKFPIIIKERMKGSYAIYLDISAEIKLRKELIELQGKLENRVKERTKELELAYDRLAEFIDELEEVNRSK